MIITDTSNMNGIYDTITPNTTTTTIQPGLESGTSAPELRYITSELSDSDVIDAITSIYRIGDKRAVTEVNAIMEKYKLDIVDDKVISTAYKKQLMDVGKPGRISVIDAHYYLDILNTDIIQNFTLDDYKSLIDSLLLVPDVGVASAKRDIQALTKLQYDMLPKNLSYMGVDIMGDHSTLLDTLNTHIEIRYHNILRLPGGKAGQLDSNRTAMFDVYDAYGLIKENDVSSKVLMAYPPSTAFTA